jgi:hypothetical protein
MYICQRPTGASLLLTRYTQPEPELQLLIQQIKLSLPPQPPPRLATGRLPSHPLMRASAVVNCQSALV